MSEQKKKKKTGIAAKLTSESAKANTVNGKRALYQQTAVDFQSAANEMLQSGIRDMQAGVKKQMNKYKEGVRDMQAGIHDMQLGIKEQINKYKEGAAAFQSGVAEMMSSTVEQIKANQEYTKQFYG